MKDPKELDYNNVLRLLIDNPSQGKFAAKALLRGRSTRDTRPEEVPLKPEDIQETVHNLEDLIPADYKQRRHKP